jgi:hypothetical protein
VARLLGRENLISREEVVRLQGLRGSYGIQAPAPICPDPDVPPGPGPSVRAKVVVAGLGEDAKDAATCQTVQAPVGTGLRLVPNVDFDFDVMNERPRTAGAPQKAAGEARDEAEIRLTYRELSALIEDAIKNLR